MKKTYRILLAGFAALAVFSCNKDVTPAAPMSTEEVQKKLSDVAVATINEVDPINYKEWGQSAIKLYDAIQTIGRNSKDFDVDFDMMLKSSTEKKEGFEITTNIIQLSLLKGDVTVKDDQFVYTESDKPFNMTIPADGKTYKIQVESAGENGDGIIIAQSTRENGDVTYIRKNGIIVPQKAAIHITEDGKQFMDIEVFPVIDDKNKNGILDETDVISGQASVVIPAYSLLLNDLKITTDSAIGTLALMHGKTSVLSVNAQVDLMMVVSSVKALNEGVKEVGEIMPKTIKGSISLMGGQAIVKADMDAEKVMGVSMHYAAEDKAKEACKLYNANVKADLYFDNNPTIQASLVFLVEKADTDEESWNVVPGLHFHDGVSADMTFDEFVTSFTSNEEAIGPVMDAAGGFMGKIALYFPELMPKKK